MSAERTYMTAQSLRQSDCAVVSGGDDRTLAACSMQSIISLLPLTAHRTRHGRLLTPCQVASGGRPPCFIGHDAAVSTFQHVTERGERSLLLGMCGVLLTKTATPSDRAQSLSFWKIRALTMKPHWPPVNSIYEFQKRSEPNPPSYSALWQAVTLKVYVHGSLPSYAMSWKRSQHSQGGATSSQSWLVKGHAHSICCMVQSSHRAGGALGTRWAAAAVAHPMS